MKWFQHQSDSYTDLALKEIIAEFGMEGYGFFWICCELIAQQGNNYCINNKKNWKKVLKLVSSLPDQKVDEILQKFAELDLISLKSFTNGILAIPKMRRYSDDTTKRLRRSSEATSEQMRLDKTRLDKIRLDKNKENTKRKKSKSGEHSEEDIKLAQLLGNLIKKNLPTFKAPKSIIPWAKEINKMRRLDKRTLEQIEVIIRFAQHDLFWQANIHSTKKLRKHFDALTAKLKTASQFQDKKFISNEQLKKALESCKSPLNS